MSTIKNEFYETLVIDISRNKGNYKISLFLFLYRITNIASKMRKQSRLLWNVIVPYLALYRFVTKGLFKWEIPAALALGKAMIIEHGHALILNKDVIIEVFCRLRYSTTIGCKFLVSNFLASSQIIGDHVTIGASMAVVEEPLNGPATVKNPARIICKNSIEV